MEIVFEDGNDETIIIHKDKIPPKKLEEFKQLKQTGRFTNTEIVYSLELWKYIEKNQSIFSSLIASCRSVSEWKPSEEENLLAKYMEDLLKFSVSLDMIETIEEQETQKNKIILRYLKF